MILELSRNCVILLWYFFFMILELSRKCDMVSFMILELFAHWCGIVASFMILELFRKCGIVASFMI